MNKDSRLYEVLLEIANMSNSIPIIIFVKFGKPVLRNCYVPNMGNIGILVIITMYMVM